MYYSHDDALKSLKIIERDIYTEACVVGGDPMLGKTMIIDDLIKK